MIVLNAVSGSRLTRTADIVSSDEDLPSKGAKESGDTIPIRLSAEVVDRW